jgi:hypothetical protein
MVSKRKKDSDDIGASKKLKKDTPKPVKTKGKKKTEAQEQGEEETLNIADPKE